MKAVVYHGHEDFRVDHVDDPSLLAPTDAIVRSVRTAICGSDLHLWHAPTREIQGFTMGHEVLGVVEDVGSEVTRIRKGDRVLVSCTTGCDRCRASSERRWRPSVEGWIRRRRSRRSRPGRRSCGAGVSIRS